MKEFYESPLSSRYASEYMLRLFSPDKRYGTWRRLWVALARAEHRLGLPVTDEQVAQLEAHVDDEIDYAAVAEWEKKLRHDVMAHIHVYGESCPDAAGIIHLGATSCYVTDNADIMIYRDALLHIRSELVSVIAALCDFAYKYRAMPTLGYTHFQPAQLVTVGKRACLWAQDFLLDLDELNFVIDNLLFHGCRGTTGTDASFLSLFDGDVQKVRELNAMIAEECGFSTLFPVAGQTYPRKYDSRILNVLSAIAQSAYRFANDMRLLQHLRQVEEPFEKNQIGSSAMAYKRNPMRSERIGSLSRYVMCDVLNGYFTTATQWFERTLDDSANKRLSIPEAFLAVDGILSLYANVADGLVVYPKVIEQRLRKELPFMATENIMMDAVKYRGADRQQLHEKIRVHSMAASKVIKEEGGENDLLERIANDEAFGVTLEDLEKILQPEKYTGRAKEQTEDFLAELVQPVLDKYADIESDKPEINV